jgi:hypothetical protein
MSASASLKGKPIYLGVLQDPTRKLHEKLLMCFKEDEIQLRHGEDLAKELAFLLTEIESIETIEKKTTNEQVGVASMAIRLVVFHPLQPSRF